MPAPAGTPPTDLNDANTASGLPQTDSSLDALEQAPDHDHYDPEMDEAVKHRDKIQGITDDINGLSLSLDKQSSYVGISSITAALKVIFRAAPVVRPFIAQTYIETALPSRANSPAPRTRDEDPHRLPAPDVGHALIETYFSRVHLLIPMVDEDQFWHTYLYGNRRDSSWMALLNIVLALGSLASSTCDDDSHIVYFQRGRAHLTLETLGSGNILVLQAIGLLSGYYLHWLNRPNEAHSLMGAALRMATALGLHREYSDATKTEQRSDQGAEVPVELRRRTWWSLVCLDTWANMTTGRPSVGRLGPGVTARAPKVPAQISNNAQYMMSVRLLPIIHSIEFCKLATQIQDKLAQQSLLKVEELFSLDAELVRWHDDLPPILHAVPRNSHHPGSTRRTSSLKSPSVASASHSDPFESSHVANGSRADNTCPEILQTPRAIMHWWYQTMRMVMHRPYLLSAALRRTMFTSMAAEERIAVTKCQIIAEQMISDINATCKPDIMAGWNAVWLMYQAAMVPLVSLFAFLSSPVAYPPPDSPGKLNGHNGYQDEPEKWRSQIQTAIGFFQRMQHYSVAAKKSGDVVTRLLDASKHVRQYYDAYYMQLELQQRRRQTSTPAAVNDNGFSSIETSDFAAAPSNTVQPPQQDPFMWEFDNADEAMNSFFNDGILWDTIPDMEYVTEVAGMPASFENIDWLPPERDWNDSSQWQDWNARPSQG